MSNIYVHEPATKGKVCLHTTVGPMDIELWSKEAPKAARNFVQLCMEGYYDRTVFNRIVPGFIAQCGDPTGTGCGGESIYGEPFRDEIHQRLKFVRRGLVAMANSGPNDNGSQFFFTFAKASELDGKHTIFGKVVGDTLYNMLKLEECEVGMDDRPVNPPKILRAEVLINPFSDIVPRCQPKSAEDEEGLAEKSKKKESKAKAIKAYNLLSFGEEAEEDEGSVDAANEALQVKSKSAHDDSASADLVATPAVSGTLVAADDDEDEAVVDVASVRARLESRRATQQMTREETVDADVAQAQQETEYEMWSERKAEEKRQLDELRAQRRQLQKELKGPEKQADIVDNDEPKSEALAMFHNERNAYAEKNKEVSSRKTSDRENQTLAMLERFTAKLRSVAPADMETENPTQESKTDSEDPRLATVESDEEEEDDAGDDWMRFQLRATEPELRQAHDANVDEHFDIHDPRNRIVKQRRGDDDVKQKKRRRKNDS